MTAITGGSARRLARWLVCVSALGCLPGAPARDAARGQQQDGSAEAASHPKEYWRGKLDPEVYRITRCSGTEAPFTGKYWNNHADGIYRCSNCGAPLFDSTDKFDSGTGWPSFTRSRPNSVSRRQDTSAGMVREEIVCKHCGAHLGHVFDDGPAPAGQRFCVNSASLTFEKRGAKK